MSKFNFQWVEQQVLKKDYKPVQLAGDAPYDNIPYPTKLPAAALEFPIEPLGHVVSNVLDIRTAINTITFSSGSRFQCYIHALKPEGSFLFDNIAAAEQLLPQLIVHNYNSGKSQSEER